MFNKEIAMKRSVFAALTLLMLASPEAQAAAPRGPVHSEKAAILMARRIWLNLYPLSAATAGSGAAWLAGEKATLDGDVWEVSPKAPGSNALGSNIVFRIAATNGMMVGYYRP